MTEQSAPPAPSRKRAGTGRLRVYLGAAPGVGKTVAMLCEGRRRCERGTDVVIGIVEDHGREYLSLDISAAVVADLDAAVRHIRRYSTQHSEAIVTVVRPHWSASRPAARLPIAPDAMTEKATIPALTRPAPAAAKLASRNAGIQVHMA